MKNLTIHNANYITFKDQFLIIDILGGVDLSQVERMVCTLRVSYHKNDADHWPSRPHGHIYDKNWVVDKEGNIFKAHNGPYQGQLSKKGKKKWKNFLKGCK